MKSDATNQSWKPTLTLAKLFEEQNQFYDALAAYELIGQSDSSPAIRQKVEALQMRILSDPNLKYDPRIEKLFSPEELAYLKILNHSAFENLSKVQEQIVEGNSAYEIIFEDEEIEENETDPATELQKMLEEIDMKTVKATGEPSTGTHQSTIGELAVELIKRYGKDGSISSMPIQDFLKLILEFNLPDKTDKK
jgi:hypothetical protein